MDTMPLRLISRLFGNSAVVVEAARDTTITIYEGVTFEEIAVGMKIEIKGVPLDNQISVLIADKVSLEFD